MSSRVYRIRRAFLIPFALVVLLLFILLLLSFVNGFTAERIVLAAMFVAALAFFCEAAFRRVAAREDCITVRKFLRNRELSWEDITNLGVVAIRRKVYILLTTKKGLYIFSNAYGDFSLLVRDIAVGVGMEKTEKGVVEQIEHPVVNNAPVTSTWGAAVIMAFIVAGRLFLF
jgi:hypothetical protein